MASRRRTRERPGPQESGYEGPEALTELLARAGSPHGADEVAEHFRTAIAAGGRATGAATSWCTPPGSSVDSAAACPPATRAASSPPPTASSLYKPSGLPPIAPSTRA